MSASIEAVEPTAFRPRTASDRPAARSAERREPDGPRLSLGRGDVKPPPDDLRRMRAKLRRLDPAKDQLGERLADGEGEHALIIGNPPIPL